MKKFQENYEKLKVLYRISTLINSTLEPEKILTLLLSEVIETFNASSGSFMEVDYTAHCLKTVVCIDIHEKDIEKLHIRIGEGVTGWVAQTGEPYIVTDAAKDPVYIKVRDDIRSELAVPLKIKGTVIGVLNVDSTDKNNFSEEDKALLTAIAGQSTQIIQNGRLYADVKRRAEEFRTLFNVGQIISSSLNLSEVLNRITEETRMLMGTKLCSIMLVDERDVDLSIAAGSGDSDSYFKRAKISLEGSLVGGVLKKCAPLCVYDVRKEDTFKSIDLARKEGLCSLISVPLLIKGKAEGVINCYTSEPREFSGHDVELLTALAGMAATAIENARLYTKLLDSEEQMRSNERLSVLGLFSAELAHEIRNPLTVISMIIEHIGFDQGKADLRKEDIQVIRSKIEDLKELVDRVLSAARFSEPQFERHDLNAIIKSAITFVRHKALLDNVVIQLFLANERLNVSVDRTQIEQVFLNVFMNAFQAMEEGGTLTISSRRTAVGTVVTEVKDTGCGIKDRDIANIFKSFYTDKKGGTGLGLAIAQRIVENHGGTIDIDSMPGEGTTLKIKLPAAEPHLDT